MEKEQSDEYAGFRFGVNPVSKERINGLMAFRTHPIDKNIVSIILNDPIQWEGIFYNQNFCNNSILEYVRTLVPELEEHFLIRNSFRMEAELKHKEGFLQGVMKKLSNEKFVNNAPAAVLELERKNRLMLKVSSIL